MTYKFQIKKGLIFDNATVIMVQEADSIARANGFDYAERFVKHYDGLEVELDDQLKVIKGAAL